MTTNPVYMYDAKFIVKNVIKNGVVISTYVVAENGRITLETYVDNELHTKTQIANVKEV